MWPLDLTLLVNLVVALVVLALSLWRWLPTRHYGRIAVAWLLGGLLGAYFFGIFVLGAGLIAAVAAGIRRRLHAAV
jgi:hypothetical protein